MGSYSSTEPSQASDDQLVACLASRIRHPVWVPSDEENLALYLAEVRKLPLLTPAEERDALKRAREGDEAARRRVIEGYLELTTLLALRLAPEGMRPLDAVQEAHVVLFRLVDDASVENPAARLTDAILALFRRLDR